MWCIRRTWVGGLIAACVLLIAACATPPAVAPPAAAADAAVLEQQVRDTERAFAQTMADRDATAFAGFIADEAVFFGRDGAIRGKAAVVAAWKPYFDGSKPPFAWAPEQVEVLPSGTLAISSGPVFAPGGEKIASFTSIWRREAPGVWRIVFDKGCNCP
ncbi:MAG: nuclear transport factor 2 family protein [Burkholderiales bacterium]